ncbi:MAG: prolipoprotein diacylglyceryl transferase [Bacteroidetes bacterium]|nr:prolipoprotein diacylglyceryl transferase [Bacteroidota bacterium]
MTDCFITWDVSPLIFSIGSFSIRWYGLLFAMSFAVGYVIMLRFFKKENLPESLLDKLSMYMLIATVVGARLGHVFFYEWAYYSKHVDEILMVWKGGLASHGAAIGILTALYFFARSSRRTYLWTLDRIVIVVALSGFFIRTGNLMNSEIYGKLTDLPWGFIFVRAGETLPRHPTQIYESLSYLCIFAFLIWYYYKKNGAPREGFLFGFFLVTLFSVRFILEFLKEPQVNFENQMTLNMGQLLSIPFILAGLIIIFRKQKNIEQKE